jgi:glycerol uptake facilitator protein
VQERGPAAYLAELLGTFALVFFVTLVLSLFLVQPNQLNPNPFIDWSVIGLVHVFVLFMLVQTLAVVSGAHFNPAVTVALTALRQIRVNDAVMYIVAQLTGGVLGALLTKALVLDEGRAVDYGAAVVSPRLDASAWLGFVAEGVGTFFLVWAIIGVAVNPSALRDWAGLVIGGTLGLIVLVFGPLTGASVNPARAFGPALVGHQFGGAGDFLLTYVAGPVVGAGLAAVVFAYLYGLPGQKGVEGMAPVG